MGFLFGPSRQAIDQHRSMLQSASSLITRHARPGEGAPWTANPAVAAIPLEFRSELWNSLEELRAYIEAPKLGELGEMRGLAEHLSIATVISGHAWTPIQARAYRLREYCRQFGRVEHLRELRESATVVAPFLEDRKATVECLDTALTWFVDDSDLDGARSDAAAVFGPGWFARQLELGVRARRPDPFGHRGEFFAMVPLRVARQLRNYVEALPHDPPPRRRAR